ncbi:MAG TPA: methyl-accepting chemotaxis protein [Noviherbaspirillum sp.]|uniref:methyl-accepting chemotaxis protein n=1 Tax=Noviherbaspirillum sp. TaxID=1926288 RepID=UPI002F931623
MKISNFKIGTRLGIGFGIMGLFLLICMGVGITMLGRINQSTDVIANDRLPKIATANALLTEINDIAIALRNMMLNEDQADRQKQIDEILSSRQESKAHLQTLERTLKVPKAQDLLKEMAAADEQYQRGQEALLQKIQAAALDDAKAYLANDLRPVLANYKRLIAEQIKLQTDITTSAATEAAETYASTRNMMLAFGAAILAFAAWIALWITRSIVRPVDEALKIANTVASGDLTSRIEVRTSDEMGNLLQALKAMNESLVSTVATVRTSTDTIATASAQVAAGSQDLSSRTEQQASSLEETASSMEELTSTVRQNADNARQANALANTASSVALKGGEVIAQVVSTMGEINASAGKIADIISVIDGIAFQTNILALNAAVEAARAGEQGRGFAVVASEVRTLAQRSAAAAKEIKALIEDSTAKVETGSALVNNAGTTMSEIVDSVKRVTDIMAEIAAASQEQTSGIEQINGAVTQMDQVTQQNAALVEEAAAASAAMQEQAAKLAQAVAVFRIDGAASATSVPTKTHAVVQKSVSSVGHRPPVKQDRQMKQRPALPKTTHPAGDWEEF